MRGMCSTVGACLLVCAEMNDALTQKEKGGTHVIAEKTSSRILIWPASLIIY